MSKSDVYNPFVNDSVDTDQCTLCKEVLPVDEITHGDKCNDCKNIQWDLLQESAKRFWTNFNFDNHIKNKKAHENKTPITQNDQSYFTRCFKIFTRKSRSKIHINSDQQSPG